MIEVTCTACGNTNLVADEDIPVGAKFVNCSSCKSRVVLPVKVTVEPGFKPAPAPPGARAPSKSPAGLGAAGAGLDLPAPKRRSALGPETSKPAPRSGLAAALDADLPAPRGPRPSAVAPAPVALDIDDLLMPAGAERTDLPTPKAAGGSRAAVPELGESDVVAPRSGRVDKTALGDLPAPRSKAKPQPPRIPVPPSASPAEPRASQNPLDSVEFDLPAVLTPGGLSDLPAPKRAPPKGPVDLPAPKGPSGLADLPTPRRAELPAKPAAQPAIVDLLTPKDAAGIIDLPTPKGPGGIADLPMPKPGPGDLPAPKGFFDDLPQPASAASQARAPAPKGFFDDLSEPASPTSQASSPELPAPKGFFDDLPGRPNKANRPVPAEPPAPKGFFDDLPGRPSATKPVPAEPPAPKGFFDDLPGRPSATKPVAAEPPAPKGFFDDLPQPSNRSFDSPQQPHGVEFELQPAPLDIPLELETGPELEVEPDLDGGPELDLGIPSPTPSRNPRPSPSPSSTSFSPPPPSPSPINFSPSPGPASFDDLDLSAPSGMRLETPSRGAPPLPAAPDGPSLPPMPKPMPLRSGMGGGAGNEISLELEQSSPAPSVKLEPKRTYDAAPARSSRGRKIVLGVLLVGAVGAGGFVLYQRYFAKPAPAVPIGSELAKARSAIAASDAEHWERAIGAARKVLESDETNHEALMIGAEALFASALADGTGMPIKLGSGRKLLATAGKENVRGVRLVRAQALSAIAGGNPDGAVDKLAPLLAQDPKDASLALYLGWAHAARGDAAEAIKAFDQAASIGVEAIKLHAIYGRAHVRLAQADLVAARTDFEAVYQLDKNHIGAQVGLAAALPAVQAQQQEEELAAVLARKDLADADQRAVLLAWVLSAEAAKRGNRYDAARERYRNALAIVEDDMRALSGLAEVEMYDGRLDAASEQITKALTISKEDIRAQLVQSELSIRKKNFPDAVARLEALAARTPPPPAADQARIRLTVGRLLDAQGDDDGAAKAFEEAAKLAGESDLAPTLAAVNKLMVLAGKATQDKDTARTNELRDRADQLLSTLSKNAENDPQLALTLGMAYLQAADAVKAEPWLRRFVEARPKDPEGPYQLAKALARLGKPDDAVGQLQKALDLAPARTEIGIELALTYEAANRDGDATAVYTKLLAATKDPSVELRARAGRFFARVGEIEKAADQGAKILAVDPNHIAGHYLKGEGLLAADQLDEARQLFLKAVEAERDPQYLDAHGRAAELVASKTGDSRAQEQAIRAYTEAIERAPKLFNPHAGLGRVYVMRHEAAKAVVPLSTAYGIRKDPDVAFKMGLAYKELQQFPVAIQWLNESLKLRPHAEASWHLGQLYLDANQGKQAAGALATATQLALAEQKKTGKAVPWLIDALYALGATHKALYNLPAAREAWLLYVGQNPPPGVKLQEVKRALETSLRGN